MIAVHLFALGGAALPRSPPTQSLRAALGRLVGPWLAATRTAQACGMWAPDPRLDSPVLRLVVVDADGRRRTVDLQGRAVRPIDKPTFGYDRAHKIASTILRSGPEGPYLRPLVRWLCRRPAARHDGRAPRRFEVFERVTPIPAAGAEGGAPTERVLLRQACPS